MDFEAPNKIGFTIYSKSGCPNCLKVKSVLKDKNYLFKTIDCDEYLIEQKELFLAYIETIVNKSYKIFPIVFFDCVFIGGYEETKTYIDKMNVSFEENFNF